MRRHRELRQAAVKLTLSRWSFMEELQEVGIIDFVAILVYESILWVG